MPATEDGAGTIPQVRQWRVAEWAWRAASNSAHVCGGGLLRSSVGRAAGAVAATATYAITPVATPAATPAVTPAVTPATTPTATPAATPPTMG